MEEKTSMKNTTRVTFSLLLGCAALIARPCAATPSGWDFTGSLHTARDTQAATLLANGEVLVEGGYARAALGSAETL